MEKTAKKGKMTEAEKRERVAQALAKKKEVENQALQIVHRLVESSADPDWLVQAAGQLNQAFYDDIVTERSIVLVCGYPLCSAAINKQKAKAAQYHISLTQKKVFNLTERRKFCSNFCFQASNYYRGQLETAPLWLRDTAATVRVKLLSCAQQTSCQLPGRGEVVDLVAQPLEAHMAKVAKIDVKTKEDDHSGSSSSDNRDESESEEEEPASRTVDSGIRKFPNVPAKAEKITLVKEERTVSRSAPQNREVRKGILKDPQENSSKLTCPQTTLVHPDEGEVPVERTERVSRASTRPRLPDPCPPVEVVTRTLGLWFNASSFKFLFRSQEENVEDDDDDEGQESLRKGFVGLRVKGGQKDEEVEEFEAKVAAFFRGTDLYKVEPCNIKDVDEGDLPEPRLPLLDTRAQALHRSRIVMDELGRVMPSLLSLLPYSLASFMASLRHLVATFTLAPNNITFRPQELRLLALFLLEMLAVREEALARCLDGPRATQALPALLQPYGLDRAQVQAHLATLYKSHSSIVPY